MVDADLSQLVGRLSLEDKARLVTGKTAWRTWEMPEIGLRQMVLSDGPVGVRGTGEIDGEVSDCLSSPTALAACWDVELAMRVGRWFAWQARIHSVDVVLAPVVNLQRSPIGGRHFECYSEDPLLTGDLAQALIIGLQAGGVAACVKHFVGNEVETNRTSYVTRMDERTLREVYLAPFERAVKAGVWCVMAAYNKAEAGGQIGSMVGHQFLLSQVLKGEWGFAGPVVSDWTALTELVQPALGGLDLAMPGPHSPWSDGALETAVEAGQIPQSCLDDKVKRLLWLAERVGALGDDAPLPPPPPDPDLPRLLAARSMVVLANQDDALPLANPGLITQIALIGPNAADTRLLGGGSGSVEIDHPISLAAGLARAFPQADITVSQGVDARQVPPPLDIDRALLPDGRTPGIQVEFLDADQGVIASAVYHQWSGTFTEAPDGTDSIHLITAGRLDEPGEHWLGVGTVGRHRVCVDGIEVAHSLEGAGGEAIINSSFNVPPAEGGTVRIVEPRLVVLEAWVQMLSTQWGPRARAALHHRLPGLTPDSTIDQACQAAATADLAIVVVGTNEETESEGWDRADLNLPGRQNDLVEAVLAARPDAIVLVNAGAPVVLPWLEQARTVLWGWLPGQAAGDGLADVLTGVTEPAGRLPWTLPKAQQDCPVPHGLPNADGCIDYSEGLDIGYRGWAKSTKTPARPFGFGLGWTSWVLDGMRLSSRDDMTVRVEVSARNTGHRAGAVVVQAYLNPPPGPGPSRPKLWLAGHSQAVAAPGQAVQVSIEVPRRAFEVWQPAEGAWRPTDGAWRLPPGPYSLAAGLNASDLTQRIEVVWP